MLGIAAHQLSNKRSRTIDVTGENSATVVLTGFPEFKEIARNELDGTFTLSSIAVSGRQLFLRTSTHLYCIGKAAN